MDCEDGVSSGTKPDTSSIVEPETSASLVIVQQSTSESCIKKPEAINEEDNVSSGTSSPDANCSICLSKIENKSFTNPCMHQFCFNCIKQWTEVKFECPLCKQKLKTIYHTVKSNDDYQELVLNPLQHFYDSDEIPMAVNERFIPDHLIASIFDESIPSVPYTRYFHAESSIYENNMWVQRLQMSCPFQESSPEFYRANPAAVQRLIPWLRREMNVLKLRPQTIERFMTLILNLIQREYIFSRVFAEEITQYTGEHTKHFVHEFYSFSTTPYTCREYLYHVVYCIGAGVGRPPVLRLTGDPVPSTTAPNRFSQGSERLQPPDSESQRSYCTFGQNQRPCVARVSSCVINPPELVILDSDDDELEVIPPTNRGPPSRLQTSCNTQVYCRPNRSGNCLSLKININLPGPSDGQENVSSRRRNISDTLPSNADSSSDSDNAQGWTNDCNGLSWKVPKKKSKFDMKTKGKTQKTASNKSTNRGQPVVSNNPTCSKVSVHSVLPLKKRCKRPAVLNSSSSDDEPNVLQNDAEPDLLALVESEVPENQSLSTDVTPSETQDVSGIPTSSVRNLTEIKNNKLSLKSDSSHSSKYPFYSLRKRHNINKK